MLLVVLVAAAIVCAVASRTAQDIAFAVLAIDLLMLANSGLPRSWGIGRRGIMKTLATRRSEFGPRSRNIAYLPAEEPEEEVWQRERQRREQADAQRDAADQPPDVGLS